MIQREPEAGRDRRPSMGSLVRYDFDGSVARITMDGR
jgi:hypothetical protein